MSDEQEVIRYVLTSLKRAAENAYPWSLTPNEAGVLVAEVERLREQRRLDNAEAARIYDFARDKGAARERDRVVGYLEWLNGENECCDQTLRNAAELVADGEHRREKADTYVEPETIATVTLRRGEEDLTVELGLFDTGWRVLTVLDENGDDSPLQPVEEEAAIALAESGVDETGRDE